MNKDVALKSPPPTKRPNRHKQIAMAPGPRILMDMQWGALMNEHLQKKVISQVSMAYSFDKMADRSIPLLFTSVDQHWHELLHRVNAFQWNKSVVQFNNKCLLDVVPVPELVYLTPDTDNICTSLDPSKTYVVGCLLDHNSRKGITREFAESHNIRMERLPIQEHITMDGRQVLTINHVAEILIRVANGNDWGKALLETIPARKNPKPLSGEAEAETQEATSEKKSWCSVQ
jgi:tRNA (guanine9-N1)-methyltransferase